jgi:hypothetical protein
MSPSLEALMLGMFPFGFVTESYHWGLTATMLAAYGLIAAASFLCALTLLLLERCGERR